MSGRRSSRGASRGARHVPRVVGRPVEGVIGLPVAGHDGRIGLAPDDGAGAPGVSDRHGVVRLAVAQGVETGGGRHPLYVQGVLDGHRQAAEGADARTLGAQLIDGRRPLAGAGRVGGDHGVDRAVHSGVAGHRRLEQLDGADLLGLQGGHQGGGVPVEDVRHRGTPAHLACGRTGRGRGPSARASAAPPARRRSRRARR